MAFDFQVAIDAADPHGLAEWWAETLEWGLEPTDEAFIKSMIDQGMATMADTVTRDGRLLWKDGAAIRHPDPHASGRPKRVLFQLVPEAKTVKNRVHLDVWVGPDNVEAAMAGLIARGATFLHRGQQGPHSWVTLADIENNEFCIS